MSELIAEARVLIRPDTTKFRDLLVAEVNTATAAAQKAVKPIVVPVGSAAAGTTRAATQELLRGAEAAKQRAAAEVSLTREQARSIDVQKTLATAEQQLAAARAGVVGASSAVAAAQRQRALAATATATAQRAVAAADALAIPEQQALARATLESTAAYEAQAVAALEAARASAVAGTRAGQAAKGVAATAAQFVGLRGATLAASGAFLGATVAAVAFAKAVGSAAQLDSQLNVFRVTVGATADEMKRVSETAQQLGRDITLPGVSATDAAEAITALGRAGLSVQDSLDGARGVLQLATAAQLSNADATKIAAAALNAFGLSGTDAVHVADLLANAANASQGEISDLGIALQQSAAVARQVGLSIENTVGFLTQLSKAGIQGSDAGTSLRVSLIRLINPTEKAQQVLDKLNVTVRDAQGNVRPDIFRQFAAAQADLSKKQQDANAAIVFGTDGLRAYSIISRSSAADSAELAAQLDKSGTAAQVAGARMSGLVGATENLKNQLSAIGITVGQTVVPALEGLATTASAALAALNAGLGPLASFATGVLDLRKKLQDLTTVNIGGIDIGLDPLKNAISVAGKLGDTFNDTSFDIKVSRLQVQQLVGDLNKIGGATKLNETVTALQDMADKFRGGDAASKQFAASLDTLIRNLQKAGETNVSGTFDVKIPPEVLSGDVGKQAAQATQAGFAAQMGKTSDFGFSAWKAGLQKEFTDTLTGVIDPGVAEFTAQASAAVASAFLKIAPAASAVTDVEFRGGTDAQRRAALLKQLNAEDAFVASLIKKGANQKRIDAAKQAAIQTQRQIDAIDQQAASAAEAAARKRQQDAQAAQTARQQAQTKFDQAFLAQQARTRQQQQNRISTAEQTPQAADDLAQQRRNLVLINAQITALNNSKVSEKAKQAAIDALVTARVATTGAIKTLQAADAEQARAIREQQQDLNQQIQAQIVGLTATDKDDEAFFRAQIRRFQRQAVALGKATVAGKQATSKALGFVEQLKQLLLARAEAKKTQDQGQPQQGLSVADILRENAETFKQNAGNLITGNQPFAGPTGFTADVAQFLTRSGTPTITVQSKADPAAAKIDQSINRLIDALTANTAAQGGGDVAPGTNGKLSKAAVRAMGLRGEAMAKFYNSRQARALEMADSD